MQAILILWETKESQETPHTTFSNTRCVLLLLRAFYLHPANIALPLLSPIKAQTLFIITASREASIRITTILSIVLEAKHLYLLLQNTVETLATDSQCLSMKTSQEFFKMIIVITREGDSCLKLKWSKHLH